jgi:cell wall-associated NlpC family hydrolase
VRRTLAAIAVICVAFLVTSRAVSARLTERSRLLHDVRKEIGRPYRWGGESPRTGFDCSGLVRWAFRTVGVHLPRTTWQMLRRGEHVKRTKIKPGDAIFFFGGEHVAIYLGNGRFIDAPHTGARVGIRRLASYARIFAARRYM